MSQPIQNPLAVLNNSFREAKRQGKWVAVDNGALKLVDKPGLWAWLCSCFGKPIVRPAGTSCQEIQAHIVTIVNSARLSSKNDSLLTTIRSGLSYWKNTWQTLLPAAATAINTWQNEYTTKQRLQSYDNRITLEEYNTFIANLPEGWNRQSSFDLIARRLATNHALTDYGMDWARLKEICSAKDYAEFKSGRLQLTCISVQGGAFQVRDFRTQWSREPKRTLLGVEWVRNKAREATGEARFLEREGLPPTAKAIDHPDKICLERLRQWKELLELSLTYNDLKHFQAEGMAAFLTMSKPLSAEAMEQCKTLHAYLKRLSKEQRQEATASPESLKEAVKSQNRMNLTSIYGSIHPDFNEDHFQLVTAHTPSGV